MVPKCVGNPKPETPKTAEPQRLLGAGPLTLDGLQLIVESHLKGGGGIGVRV